MPLVARTFGGAVAFAFLGLQMDQNWTGGAFFDSAQDRQQL